MTADDREHLAMPLPPDWHDQLDARPPAAVGNALERVAPLAAVAIVDDAAIAPATGEVIFRRDDHAGIAAWLRAVMDAEAEHLAPLKRLAGEWLYEQMDADLVWMLHLDNGLTVSGESPATYEASKLEVDAAALAKDLRVLYQRSHPFPDPPTFEAVAAWIADRDEWIGRFVKTTHRLTDDGKRRLASAGLGGLVTDHTRKSDKEPRRKAPTVKRA